MINLYQTIGAEIKKTHPNVRSYRQLDPTGKVARDIIERSFPKKLPSNTKLIIDIDPYGVM